MKILVINAGSSSLKYQLIDMIDNRVMAKGVCERVTMPKSVLVHCANGEKYTVKQDMPDHQEALKLTMAALCSPEYGVIKSLSEIDAVGHRVLHGAEDYKDSVLIDDEVVRVCNKNRELGPLHMPANVSCIEACRKLLSVPQVAVFDTSFHQTMPAYAYRYALPEKFYTEWRMRRYGFHGTSHKYVSAEAYRILGDKNAKVITCHLGNGSSIAAVNAGKCVDTSMGFTPLEGVAMGTRSGDIDPALLEVIANKTGMTIGEVVNVCLNKQSGMFGLAGMSDFRDLNTAADIGDEKAKLALELFAYRVKKYIGSYMVALNGADCIVMTGGIGENSTSVRRMILENMEGLGVKLDTAINAVSRGEEKIISAADSKVKIIVIPTNEELVIANDTLRLVNESK